jgi:PKD repeat protein
MKNFNRLLLILSLSGPVLFTSCGDDKDDPKPATVSSAQASFTADRKIVEVGEVVTFANASTNATKYEWDFGNGQSSTIASPTATYTATGTYTVKLTAYNSENKTSVTTTTVKVGERFWTGLTIKNLNFSTSTGGNWDIGSGPDLRFSLKKGSETTWSQYNLKNDVVQADLPLAYNIATPLKLTNETWNFFLEDVDNTTNETMSAWNGNPNLVTKDYNTGKGVIPLTNGLFSIEMAFEVR